MYNNIKLYLKNVINAELCSMEALIAALSCLYNQSYVRKMVMVLFLHGKAKVVVKVIVKLGFGSVTVKVQPVGLCNDSYG